MAIPEHVEVLLNGVEAWNQWRKRNTKITPDLTHLDLSPERIKGTDICVDFDEEESTPGFEIHGIRAFLPGIDLRGSKLSGAVFRNAFLENAIFSNTIMNEVVFDDCIAESALFRQAVISNASFKGAYISRSFFTNAELHNSTFESADLSQANFQNAKMQDVDLRNSDMRGATFDEALILRPKFNTKSKYQGINLGSCFGSQRFNRTARDQGYIEEWRQTFWGRLLYWPWQVSSLCGRSFGLWAFWSLFIAFIFGCRIFQMGPECFHSQYQQWSFLTAQYYSIVTFSTLGFGDVVPKCTSGAVLVATEVVIGYLMLGGLISVLANKIARRG